MKTIIDIIAKLVKKLFQVIVKIKLDFKDFKNFKDKIKKKYFERSLTTKRIIIEVSK